MKASYGTNTASYRHIPSNKTHTITVPDGSYSIDDLSNYIHFTMVRDGCANSFNTPSGIRIYANPVFNRVTISVNEEFELNLGKGLAYLLGLIFRNFRLPTQKSMGP